MTDELKKLIKRKKELEKKLEAQRKLRERADKIRRLKKEIKELENPRKTAIKKALKKIGVGIVKKLAEEPKSSKVSRRKVRRTTRKKRVVRKVYRPHQVTRPRFDSPGLL